MDRLWLPWAGCVPAMPAAGLSAVIPPPASAFDEAEFRRDQADAFLDSIRVATVLGVLAFVSFGFVDRFLARDTLTLLIEVRAGVVAVLLAILAGTFFATEHVRRWTFVLSVGTCIWMGFGVIVVTALVGGAATNYHEALLLTFFGFGALPFPWRWQHAMLTYTGTVLAYDVVMLSKDLDGTTAQWITVNAVLWFAVLIASAITWHGGNLRRQEFTTRRQLAAANQQLHMLDTAKTAFFTNISHELRTPLTLVLAPLESLLEQSTDLTPPQHEQLTLARRSAIRLLKLVDDLLVLSRIEGAALRLYKSTFDVSALAAKLTEEAATLARRKHIAVTFVSVPAAVHMRGDEEQTERVLLNLLANALKFTPAGGKVVVTVGSRGSASEGGTEIDISVADTGPGIPEAQRQRVFERFHQVDSTDGRRFGGTGIGLSLARELVQLHGGTIQAEANPGGGTVLRIILPAGTRSARDSIPLKQAENVGMPEWHEQIRRGDEYRLLGLDEATERRIGRRQTQEGNRATVLVIEDNTDMVRFLAGVLGSHYTVLAAADGRTGVRMAVERRPDLILSDVTMPEMTGWEVISKLREDPLTRSIPVVLLTARGAPEDKLRGREQGADAYMTKPFQVSELMAVIRGLLRNQDDRESLQAARRDEELDSLIRGVLHTVGAPAEQLARDPTALRAVERLQDGLTTLVALLPLTPAEEARRVATPTSELARRATGSLGGDARRVDLQLNSNRSLKVVPDRIERALLELLQNALRATPADRSVTLLTLDEGESGVAFVVRDDGPGVQAAVRERIFQPFYSATGRAGLGLALARRIARSEGGTLTLDSEDRPFGARFVLRLP